MRSVEHARVFLFNCYAGAEEFRRAGSRAMSTALLRRMVDGYDPAACAAVFRAFVRNGTWYVPTHLTRKMDAFADDSAYRHDPRAKYVPQAQWTRWNRDADGMVRADTSRAGRRAFMDFYTKGREITGAAHLAGVGVLLGTDAGDSFIFPGSSAHEELAELVAAGLSPAEALGAGTWRAAEFLGRTADFGAVARGKVADLVLLDADPLTDITNTRRIRAVMLGGHYLDRAALDALLAGAERAAAGMP
jgi:imidazolonepropionase-like amidohydrolase